MPKVGNKKYTYDKKGIQKAMKAMEERSKKKGYTGDEIVMAMKMKRN